MNKIILKHKPLPLENGKWLANFELEFYGEGGHEVHECSEPREDMTYHTRDGAKRRNRELAANWVNANAPEWILIERIE